MARARPNYRRPLIYALAIVGPTLVLLFLGLQSVQRQRRAIASLSLSNLRLSGDRLAENLERRTWRIAEACLKDPALSPARPLLERATAPEEVRQVRALLEGVKGRHRIALHFFLMEEGVVRFPMLRAPPPRRLESYLAREAPAVRAEFSQLFERAGELEIVERRFKPALDSYRQAHGLAVSDPLKAIALSRVARCAMKLGQPSTAAEAYRGLVASYAGQYDLFHRPFGLVAGLELDELLASSENAPGLTGLYPDLTSGRWELAAEHWDYFVTRLEARGIPPARGTPYGHHLEMGRALEEAFRHHGALRTDEVYAFALEGGPYPTQTFYATLPASSRPDLLIGFAADLDWIRSVLLRESRNELGLEAIAVDLKVAPREAPVEEGTAARVAFRSLFPFWQLSLSLGDTASSSTTRREFLVFGGVTLLVLFVLGLGVFLLVRDAARETEMSRLRADFVSAVSHELKTPLTLIRLYAETLLHGKDFTEQEKKDYYQIITRESERLTHLLHNVLDFSRIDRGQKQYNLEEADLSPVVRRTVDVYGDYLERRGFVVEADLRPELPDVAFDPEAISQALVNLLDNAAKFSEDSKFVAVRLRAEDGRLVLEVEDHGMGIAAQEQEKIFERFYRGRDRGDKGGYGLGLFLVRHIMEAHGGAVEAESEPGRGSRFRLLFPLASGR